MISKRTFLSNAAAAGLALAAGPAAAQSYPDHPLKLIVPFAPGGPMDVMARLIGQHAQASLKQPVIVENRAGAGGALGSKAVAVADPEAVRRLKDAAERDLGVSGPGLARHAFAAGLVDEVHLFVFPIIVGGGKSGLPRDVRVDLELLDERRFGNGVVHLHHRTR